MSAFSRSSALLALAAGMIVGCGPTTRTANRFEWKPYDANEYRQVKDGLVVENVPAKELPPVFFATVQACDQNGIPLVKPDAFNKPVPVAERVSLARPNQYWYQVSITNENDHVVRLNSVVVRLFDPAGNQIEPISKEDAISTLLANRPCPSTQQAAQGFRLVKFMDRNVELLPKTTTTGWLAFEPPSTTIPGTWKLALYDLPTQTDPAGNVTRRTRFEIRTVVHKYVDTFRSEGLLKPEVLVKSEEVAN